METVAKILGAVLIVVVLLVAATALFTIPVYFLYNWLMPELFGLKSITLVQAWGLTFLCGLLFKSTSTSSTSK